jgi:hypothetical protein
VIRPEVAHRAVTEPEVSEDFEHFEEPVEMEDSGEFGELEELEELEEFEGIGEFEQFEDLEHSVGADCSVDSAHSADLEHPEYFVDSERSAAAAVAGSAGSESDLGYCYPGGYLWHSPWSRQ